MGAEALRAAVHAGDDTDTVAADLRDLALRVADRGAEDAEAHRVSDELHEVAEHLVARGLGEGHDFYVRGRPVPHGPSSEFIGLEQTDAGGYRVWYLGDWGTERDFVETADWSVARACFVEEAVALARGSHRNRTIVDHPGQKRRWWKR